MTVSGLNNNRADSEGVQCHCGLAHILCLGSNILFSCLFRPESLKLSCSCNVLRQEYLVMWIFTWWDSQFGRSIKQLQQWLVNVQDNTICTLWHVVRKCGIASGNLLEGLKRFMLEGATSLELCELMANNCKVRCVCSETLGSKELQYAYLPADCPLTKLTVLSVI
jgi:hypothetical protein